MQLRECEPKEGRLSRRPTGLFMKRSINSLMQPIAPGRTNHPNCPFALSGPGRKSGDVCGEELSAQARRERRAYPARESV